MNKKCCELLKEVVSRKYSNIKLDSYGYNDDEFYYDFKCNEQVSENDFEYLENEIKKIDSGVYIKLIRIR